MKIFCKVFRKFIVAMANVREGDNNSIEDCCVEFPSTSSDTLLNSLPHLDILTSNSNMPSLSDIDMDQQIPFNTNFKYYSPHDFHSDADINNLSASNNFSVLHSNIRSLSANHDKLLIMLDELKFQFSVIEISEIKLKVPG
jgi:hypothetical protein